MKKRKFIRGFSIFATCFLGLGAALAASQHLNTQHVEIAKAEAPSVSTLAQLQEALASDATEIIVTARIDISESIVLDGHGKTIRAEKPCLNAQGIRDDNATDLPAVFNVSGAITAKIQNMTIMGGRSKNSASWGAVNGGSSVTKLELENVTITRSYTALVARCPTIVKNCNFVRNAGSGYGAIRAYESTCKLVLENCSICENRSTTSDEDFGGGGITAEASAKVYINNCVIANNTSRRYGGGIYVRNTTSVYMINSTVTGNATTTYENNGGGIAVQTMSSAISLANCFVNANYFVDGTTSNKVRSDIACRYDDAKVYAYYSILGSNVGKFGTNKTNTIVTTGSNIGSADADIIYDARADGVIDYLNRETTSVPRPKLYTESSNSNRFYIPAKNSGVSQTQGTKTYLSYSDDLSTIKVGFYNKSTSAIQNFQSDASTLPTNSDLISKYFDDTARPSSYTAVGACAARSGDTTYVAKSVQSNNGHMGGVTIFGETVTAGQEITMTGYPNSGKALWYFDVNAFNKDAVEIHENPGTYTVPVNAGDITVTPYFGVPVYVSFNACGGSGTVPETMMGVAGATITLPDGDGLTKPGQVFYCWNTDPDGSGVPYNAGQSFTVGSNHTTLYAQYIANPAIAETEGKITAIGEVVYTAECEGKIAEARAAYDALSEADQAFVTNYQTLVDAEAAYALLKADHDAAKAVYDLISAIPSPVELTDEDAIVTARTAYDALTAAQKELVGNYQTLLDAEAALKTLKDQAAADTVKGLINGIGTVTLEKEDEIVAARTAYDALSADQKALVTNYSTLTDAEAALKALKDQQAADAVIALINAIGELEYSQDCKDKIDAAKAAYDALSEEAKALVTNYSTLQHDVETYEHIEHVIDLINGIGDVDYSDESKDKIDDARDAYDALTEEERELIPETFVEELEQAEETYAALEEEAQKHKPSSGVPGWAIALIIIGGIILLAAIAYVLLFFVLNKWIKKDDKALRAFKIGKKDDQVRLMLMNFKFEYRPENEVFNSKDEALNK